MKRQRRLRQILVLLSVAAFASSTTLVAEDVARKWRLGFAVGAINPADEVKSDAGNTHLLVDDDFELVHFYEDPRDDSAVFGSLDVSDAPLGTVHAQFALNKFFMVEGSIGYQEGDIGDVEVSVQFTGNEPPIPEIPFNFDTFRVKVGELTRIPIQLSGHVRFRPRAKFNPYFGAGIGYAILGFDADPAFNRLSANMDATQGRQLRLTDSLGGGTPQLANFGSNEDLTGAEIDVRDTFEWHLAAGAEYSIRRKWAVFVDLRWIDASRDIRIGFNNEESLGIGVEQKTAFFEGTEPLFGGVLIPGDGLIDAGEVLIIPKPEFPGADCVNEPGQCEIEWFYNDDLLTDPRVPDGFVPNGEPDPGVYYVDGGKFSYDGYALQIGFRYTFK